jgi:biotin-dependent carboxylase-like uncharacterized protein
MKEVEILSVFGLASIQDGGRIGFRKYGVPVSGFMDFFSAKGANRWLGKDANSALIELIGGAVKLFFHDNMRVAITGAATTAKMGDQPYGTPCLLDLQSGEMLIIDPPSKGNIVYIALDGLIDSKVSLGSSATYPPAQLGGISGGYLKAKDRISVKPSSSSSSTPFNNRYYADSGKLRIMEGPEIRSLSEESRKALFSEAFTLSSNINRVGYRVTGTKLSHERISDLSSRVVTRGTIQLPPDGQPIILMSDAPITGGYPRIGQVIEQDIDLLAQMRPGSKVRFAITPATP